MDKSIYVINKLMVEVFNDILKIEETVLKKGEFNDVTVAEVHTIEAIGMYEKPTASEVSKTLNITAGTLSVAINNLVKKGYVQRFNGETDRRVVHLGLSKKGRLLYRVHERFHSKMIVGSVTGLTDTEKDILAVALGKVHEFLINGYLKDKESEDERL